MGAYIHQEGVIHQVSLMHMNSRHSGATRPIETLTEETGMLRTSLLAMAVAFAAGAHGAGAVDYAKNATAPVRVRYMVSDVPAATDFYMSKLGFKVDFSAGPTFAALSRDGLQLLLSPVKGPGGASQPMPSGERPTPGGW